MNPRRQAASFYRDIDIPLWVVASTWQLWLGVGTLVALHYHTFDLPALEANAPGFVSGGFVTAGFYIPRGCD